MGAYASYILCEGKSKRIVAYRDGKFQDYDVEEALNMTKDLDEYTYEVAKLLGR